MKALTPSKLEKGDTIGVISPAGPSAGLFPGRLERGLKEIIKMGYKVKVGKNAMAVRGHKAGTTKQRLEDLYDMFEDKAVNAIVTTIGGYNSNDLLDLIDYNLIKKNPKIMCGYSDITSLLSAINRMTGLVTFYGPQIMPQFADYGGTIEYTKKWFVKILSSTKPIGKIEPSSTFTHELLWWEKDDVRSKKMLPATGINTIVGGTAEGQLVGGHLGTILQMAGTKYFPDFKGKILFWEDTESSTAITDRLLSHLRILGIFDQISGMIIGRTNPDEYSVSAKNYDLEKVIYEATADYDFPIMCNMDFGHTDPMFTMPYGIKAKINADTKEFFILEAAVR